jgi:hypothetical protein
MSEPKRKGNFVMEAMTKALVASRYGTVFTVRVWTTVDLDNPQFGPDPVVVRTLECPPEAHADEQGRFWASGSINWALMDLWNKGHPISAFEILDPLGNGIVVYPDWS